MHALEQLAHAGIDIPDLVNGVLGKVDYNFDPDAPNEQKQQILAEVVSSYHLFSARGWKREKKLEEGRFRDRPEIEYRVFYKKCEIGGKKEDRWATILLVRFMGLSAAFVVRADKPS